MALKSPLMPSPTASALPSSLSPYSDPDPSSPSIYSTALPASEKRSSARSDSLAPPASPYPPQIEPSPVDSNGTDGTDIDESAQESTLQEASSSKPASGNNSPDPLDVEVAPPDMAESVRNVKIDTQMPGRDTSATPDDAPQSVIHAPEGFKDFDEASLHSGVSPSDRSGRAPVSPSVNSPSTPEAISAGLGARRGSAISPVNTDLPKLVDRSTPRAQTRPEAEGDSKRMSRRKSSLEGIPEVLDKNVHDDDPPAAGEVFEDSVADSAMHTALGNAEGEIEALRAALSECWTLCNTLASLSSVHRQRSFKVYGMQTMQEQVWRSCWRLCQKLYDSRDERRGPEVVSTLELIRDFCQALFDVRQTHDEVADSVLRVSFELNNHLYNTHDRSLPEAYTERTLDFYVTLCHRMMKQRTTLPQETDALLRACWSLAEMLFNLRQNDREDRTADEEELLGSAVQACWELCDLFREGWTQVRPERATPRPSQKAFHADPSTAESASNLSSTRSTSSLSNPRTFHDAPGFPPETPTTIFDDATTATSSPTDSVNVPNILVLGPGPGNSSGSGNGNSNGNGNGNGRSLSSSGRTHHDRWTSSASVLSDYSSTATSTTSSSKHTSSTATAETDQAHLTRLRCLLLRAGMNTGYDRASGGQLTAHVAKLSPTAFGVQPWQTNVLKYYRKLVLGDKSMLSVHGMAARRLGAHEVAKSVRWLGEGSQWAWMRDLFRLVFGFGVDEALVEAGKGASAAIQI